MDIKVDAKVGDGKAWSEEWHAKRNAAVAALVADGTNKNFPRQDGDVSREDADDATMRGFFWRFYKPDSERSQSERMESPDARLYECVTQCMRTARDDERQRIAKALSAGLQALLGDEFRGIMYDLAMENDINIGRD